MPLRTPLRASLRVAPVLAVVALAVGGVTAAASTPSAGNLSPTTGPATWTGGPFAVPNATGNAGAVDCTAPQSCDDYALSVDSPAGYGDDHTLSIAVSWPNKAADFDVYVLDAAGAVVGTSASSADPETVVLPPDSGTYTVRVVPYLPLGQSYSAKASLVTKTRATPPTSTAVAPKLATYGAPEAFTDAHNAGEPSIGVSHPTNSSFFQSSLSTYKVDFKDTVSPPTATWRNVAASVRNGCPQGSTTSLDPILYTDPVTGRTFESQLSGVDSLTCYTDDGGITWHPSQGGGIPSGVDHQTLGGGNFVASDPLNAANTYPRAVYYCSQDIATAFCALSRDGGNTFGAGVPVYNLLDCGGLHGHIAVAPDGTAYLPNKSCGGAQGVVVSADNGKTWTIRTVPGSTPGDSDPAVSIGSNGTVYFSYANGDGTSRVAVSHDQGQTWTDLYDVGQAVGTKNTVFPTIVAGDDDRAAASWIGTTTSGNYQDAANFTGVWHLYTAYTYDGGASWRTVDDTPTDPVQRGSICTGGTTCGNDRNLLDFIGSTVDDHGRVEVAFADGCTGACATGGAQNFDAYATIARQYFGLTLYAEYDPLPNLTVSRLTFGQGANGRSTIGAVLADTSTRAATSKIQILVDGTVLSTSDNLAVPAKGSVKVTVPWSTRSLHGTHTITAVADPSDSVRESRENDNRRTLTVTLP